MKILVAGEVKGRLDLLITRVAALHASKAGTSVLWQAAAPSVELQRTRTYTGPFDALFCVGDFYPGAEDDATAFEDYLCGACCRCRRLPAPLLYPTQRADGALSDTVGAKEVPIPTYFIEGPPASAEAKYGAITGACVVAGSPSPPFLTQFTHGNEQPTNAIHCSQGGALRQRAVPGLGRAGTPGGGQADGGLPVAGAHGGRHRCVRASRRKGRAGVQGMLKRTRTPLLFLGHDREDARPVPLLHLFGRRPLPDDTLGPARGGGPRHSGAVSLPTQQSKQASTPPLGLNTDDRGTTSSDR